MQSFEHCVTNNDCFEFWKMTRRFWYYSFSQLLWLNSQFFFFFETISSDLWTKLLVHIRWEFLIDLCKLQKLWHMCANSKYNCLQFAQQLIAYGLLIKTDESDSHLCQTLHNFSIIFPHVSHHIQNDPFNYEKLVYMHVYSINIWHWHCL